jgi:SAM-dependent methyltransferase
VSCPACGGPLAAWRVGLERCEHCGTAVTTGAPAPEDPRGYGTERPRLAGVLAPLLSAFDRARLRLLGRVAPPPGRLVDAGAGRGRFVAAARAAGYDAVGIEPSAGAVAVARALYDVELREAGIDGAAFEGLDAVTVWHVLEHLDDPAAALERIAGWLRPGGGLLVGVPNLASVQARIGGSRWFHLDVPRHRVHFTPAGVRALLERCGFEVVAERHVLLEHNPFGMWQTLVNRVTFTPSWLFRALQRDAPLRVTDAVVTLIALPLVPVAALLELACGLARRGGTVAVVATAATAPQR